MITFQLTWVELSGQTDAAVTVVGVKPNDECQLKESQGSVLRSRRKTLRGPSLTIRCGIAKELFRSPKDTRDDIRGVA